MRSSKQKLLPLSLMSLTLLQLPMFASAETNVSARSASGIYFSTDVPDDQYQELARDLEELSSVPITHPDSKLLSVMRIKDPSPESLLSWLTERVHFIVDQNYRNLPEIIDTNYVYPNQEIAPVQYDGLSDNDENEFSILMSNVGSSFYKIAKQNSMLVSIQVPGVGNVRITSPRVGLIKIGPGLFDDNYLGADKSPRFRNARRTLQLATLFHEGRHNDGYGAHLTFSHMICPTGHAYAGKPACDANLNGPYSVESHLINSIARSCTQCSAQELETLKLAALDSASRIQKEFIDPAKDPVAVLRNTQMRSSLCDKAEDLGMQDSLPDDLKQDCAEIPALQKLAARIIQGFPIPVIKATDWDPTPEGTFDPARDIQ